MTILELARKVKRYTKDLFLLPVNIRRLLVQQSSAETVESALGSHDVIRSNLVLLKADCSKGTVRLDGINYHIDPARSIETLNEVVLRRDYEFNWPFGRYVVIDIGMNVGYATILKAKDPNVIHVYGFEPLTPTYKLARRNIEFNPSLEGKITSFNFGLADVDAELAVMYGENDIMSASSEGTFDTCFAGATRTESIRIRQASTILAEIFERHVDVPIFLKCDCEGAEFKIFRNLHEHGLLERISVAIIEWHGREPGDLLTVLTSSGFSCFSQLINVEWNVGIIRAVRTSNLTECK